MANFESCDFNQRNYEIIFSLYQERRKNNSKLLTEWELKTAVTLMP